jgi:hypothetical protein
VKVRLTKDQQRALKAVFDRGPIDDTGRRVFVDEYIGGSLDGRKAVTYRQFRRTVIPCYGDTCIMVPWAGMWLGIERDGYTHS